MNRYVTSLLIAVLALGAALGTEVWIRLEGERVTAQTAAASAQSLQRAIDSVWVIITPKGSSSAVKIADDTFVTALHVLTSNGKAYLTHPKIDRDTRFRGRVVYADKKVDLAIVKLEQPAGGPNAIPAESSPASGEKVMVVGYPLGMFSAVRTEGVAADLVESPFLKRGKGLLTSAQMAPGNSGGGLFYQNDDGHWVLAGISHVVRAVKTNSVWHLSLFIPAESVHSFVDCAVYDVKKSCHHDINSLNYNR